MRRRQNPQTAQQSEWATHSQQNVQEAEGQGEEEEHETADVDSSEDEGFTIDRLNQIRMRVAARELNSRVEGIMNLYYVVLFLLGLNFYRIIGKYGVDLAVQWYCIGGATLLVVAAFMYVSASKLGNMNLSAASGMLAITGAPVITMAVFTYLWVSIFFKHTWREKWLSWAH
jgi:hypothetical protein